MFIVAFAGLILDMRRKRNSGAGYTLFPPKEVALTNLTNYARNEGIRVDDFGQPKIWVKNQKCKDNTGCIIVEYQTLPNVFPRHCLLLYIHPKKGVVDEKRLIE